MNESNVIEFPTVRVKVSLTPEEQTQVRIEAAIAGVSVRTMLRRILVEEALLQLESSS